MSNTSSPASLSAESTARLQNPSYQTVGLLLGPALFALMMLFADAQTTMNPVAWKVAAIGLWMAAWWATEAVPVPVTALLPIATFELVGITSIKEAAAPYANPIIYLFMGAFVLALAVERWNLHKRIALMILSRTGTDGRRMIGGFMLVAALLSMWMTNTSTTMMLFPIAISVTAIIVEHVQGLTEQAKSQFQTAMLLALAYAATIGGLATLVGTPPNALLAAFMTENYGIEIGFARWMLVGVPVAAILLPAGWLLLTRWIYRVEIPESAEVKTHLRELQAELGPISRPEARVASIFALVVLAWMLRRPLSSALGLEGLSDAGIAMIAALLLFLMPSGDHKQPHLMTWHDVGRLPWGVLILFGGGLSLAAQVSESGLAAWLGESLSLVSAIGVVALVIAATALVIFLTELTSNLATTATFLPAVAAIAVQADISPLLLCVPVTLAASCAFMLPVATPPNAIVYASGLLTIPQMVRAGIALNLFGLVVLTLVAIQWAPRLLN
ncbi:DASS family sodium-coupled anion symporter [Microbulbifer bruguierae]|uniref:DASS family sodium-coupled anion symporter n=1 Tax=Microbulbifer bruguierae TaxID=3029061 RepID=A0ABY8NAR9_9GAMM|nr:DASS family sodium-coupled anion symporter [Microbulbifer bruguierae]WGL15545.1 DASS family sodium-coupled anion symporter [Microbulbifer bruguierae]